MPTTLFCRSWILDRTPFSLRADFASTRIKRHWSADSRLHVHVSTTIQETNESTESVQESVPKQGGWNKGQTMAEEVRDKIRDSLKGRIPWNKGKKLSHLTREKMRFAKLGSRHSLASRRKMSISHTGKTHSSETMRLLSKKLSNVPKTSEHRRKISSSQKRRHAVNKALKAIETAHKVAGPIYSDPKSLPVSTSIYLTQSMSRKSLSREKKTRSEVLNTYKALLREYRSLQEELMPWMTAFEAKHLRKPHLSDVEATQIAWLISNFKNYLLLRKKLFRDIPFLRNAMNEAPEHGLKAEILESKDQIPILSKNGSKKPTSSLKTSEDRLRKLSASNEAPERIRKAMSAALEYKKTHRTTPVQVESAEQVSEAKARALEAIMKMKDTK